MAILVVCPGCHKRFKVSDQFAGQTGACPSCKGKIEVPKKSDEVKVHGPEAFAEGGRSVDGTLITKPIARTQTKFNPIVAVAVAGAALCVLVACFFLGSVIRENMIVMAIGVLLISPPLVLAGYTFLRNDELEPYRSKELYIRAAIIAVTWAILWGAFGYLVDAGFLTGDMWSWLAVATPLIVVGAMVSSALLDLDFGSGVMHYSFYLLITIILRWAAGMGWIWDVGQ